jgi:pilus assembly protein CpaF
VFGKRATEGEVKTPPKAAPPPAPAAGPAIATRPQKVDIAAEAAPTAAVAAPAAKPAAKPAAPGGQPGGPKPTVAFEQLRRAQAGREAPATTQIVREQSDYYHATKTTIFNALINTIDLAQLAQLDVKQAGEEIRDIATVRWSRCSPVTTSPTSWSTAPTGCSSKSAARSS